MEFGQYEGQLNSENKACGWGKLTRENGVIYKGTFKDDLCHGFGMETYDNGTRWEGMADASTGYARGARISLHLGALVLTSTGPRSAGISHEWRHLPHLPQRRPGRCLHCAILHRRRAHALRTLRNCSGR